MNKKLVGQKLIRLRGKRTREEVAQFLSVSVSSLAMYERGERTPRDEIKIKLASFYDVSIEWLFFNIQPHNKCINTA
jgi:putative transcriptional regulator